MEHSPSKISCTQGRQASFQSTSNISSILLTLTPTRILEHLNGDYIINPVLKHHLKDFCLPVLTSWPLSSWAHPGCMREHPAYERDAPTSLGACFRTSCCFLPFLGDIPTPPDASLISTSMARRTGLHSRSNTMPSLCTFCTSAYMRSVRSPVRCTVLLVSLQPLPAPVEALFDQLHTGWLSHHCLQLFERLFEDISHFNDLEGFWPLQLQCLQLLIQRHSFCNATPSNTLAVLLRTGTSLE
jgi:hypothetical protein